MKLVLPYLLPPPALAADLAPHVAPAAPRLSRWLAECTLADDTLFDIATHACTADQGWRLQAAGYQPEAGLPLGAGWALLTCAQHTPGCLPDAQQRLWQLDLSHFNVTQHGVQMLSPAVLAVQPDESEQLLDDARYWFAESGATVRPGEVPGQWYATLPDTWLPPTATREITTGDDLQDWWTHDASTRPWRQLANTLQMAWHDHRVNQQRAAHGLPAIQGVWLSGGGRLGDFARAPATVAAWTEPPPPLAAALRQATLQQDPHGWLQALQALDQWLPPRAETLVLTGRDRIVTLKPAFWPRLRARWQRTPAWQAWWVPANAPVRPTTPPAPPPDDDFPH